MAFPKERSYEMDDTGDVPAWRPDTGLDSLAGPPRILMQGDLQQRAFDYLSSGISPKTTFTLLKIRPSFDTIVRAAIDGFWLGQPERPIGPEMMEAIFHFLEEAERCMAVHQVQMVDSIRHRALDTESKMGDWRAGAFLLTHGHTREEWHEHKDSTINVEVHDSDGLREERRKVRQLSESEILDLADPALAGLVSGS